MKYLFFICIFFINTSAYTQADIQIVKVKHDDRSVTVYAVNNSDIVYNVKVNIDLEGMKMDYSPKATILLVGKTEEEIALLKPTKGPARYKINFQASAIEESNKVTIELNVPDITIYTKNKQEKSTQLKLHLQKNGIPYNEVNVTYDAVSTEMYGNMLSRRNIVESQAKLPVVIIRGVAYYKIKNMKSFIKEHL